MPEYTVEEAKTLQAVYLTRYCWNLLLDNIMNIEGFSWGLRNSLLRGLKGPTSIPLMDRSTSTWRQVRSQPCIVLRVTECARLCHHNPIC